MEKTWVVIIQRRKVWWLLAAVLSCLFIIWVLTKNNDHMTATKSVRGMVYKATSGQPVEGAMVMIAEGFEHPDIASQSDEHGSFYLPAIRVPGTYTLLINYNEQSKTVTV